MGNLIFWARNPLARKWRLWDNPNRKPVILALEHLQCTCNEYLIRFETNLQTLNDNQSVLVFKRYKSQSKYIAGKYFSQFFVLHYNIPYTSTTSQNHFWFWSSRRLSSPRWRIAYTSWQFFSYFLGKPISIIVYYLWANLWGLSLRAGVICGHFRIGEELKVTKSLRNNNRFLGVSVVFWVSVFNL